MSKIWLSTICYLNLECMIEKTHGCKNNPVNSFIIKTSEHIPSCFCMCTISSIRSINNKLNVYRGKYCIKKFGEFLREQAMKIINCKKWKTELITKEKQESYENA